MRYAPNADERAPASPGSCSPAASGDPRSRASPGDSGRRRGARGMTDRMRRVNEALKEVLSEGIGDLKDPRIGFVTVTGVHASRDLRHARVYVSVLGSEEK